MLGHTDYSKRRIIVPFVEVKTHAFYAALKILPNLSLVKLYIMGIGFPILFSKLTLSVSIIAQLICSWEEMFYN